jgi:hypothetical protein
MGRRRLGTPAIALAMLTALAMTSNGASARAPTAKAGGSQVFVNCQTFASGRFVYHASVHPSSCTFQGLPNGGAKEWTFTKLRWSGWGTTIAVATGLYHYRHGEYKDGKLVFPTVTTRVVLSRIRTGCGGRRFYTSVGDGEGTNRLANTCKAEQ